MQTGIAAPGAQRLTSTLALAVALCFAACGPALAGSGVKLAPRAQHHKEPGFARSRKPPAARKVEVGAGTTSKETTGFSGPKSPPASDKTPPAPSKSKCKDFHGAVQRACLETVLRGPASRSARPSTNAFHKGR